VGQILKFSPNLTPAEKELLRSSAGHLWVDQGGNRFLFHVAYYLIVTDDKFKTSLWWEKEYFFFKNCRQVEYNLFLATEETKYLTENMWEIVKHISTNDPQCDISIENLKDAWIRLRILNHNVNIICSEFKGRPILPEKESDTVGSMQLT
jgi:hypothetical protein